MNTITKNQKQKESKNQNRQQREKLSEGSQSSKKLKPTQNQFKQQANAEAEDESLLGFTVQESEIEAFYQRVAADEARRERHAQDLLQTPGLEHLTLEEALEKVEFMQRFAALVFQRHCREQYEQTDGTIEVESNKKVTASPSTSTVPNTYNVRR